MKIHRVDNIMNHAAKNLFEAIAVIRTKEEAELFFQDLCTPSEIQAMADRWLVVSSIKAEKPYRQIHDETGVSVTTVGRVARCLMLGEGGYNLIFGRLAKKIKKLEK
jgi:TrpR-related protein YerC/YecD